MRSLYLKLNDEISHVARQILEVSIFRKRKKCLILLQQLIDQLDRKLQHYVLAFRILKHVKQFTIDFKN